MITGGETTDLVILYSHLAAESSPTEYSVVNSRSINLHITFQTTSHKPKPTKPRIKNPGPNARNKQRKKTNPSINCAPDPGQGPSPSKESKKEIAIPHIGPGKKLGTPVRPVGSRVRVPSARLELRDSFAVFCVGVSLHQRFRVLTHYYLGTQGNFSY